MKKKTSTTSAIVVMITIFVVILGWYVVAPGYKESKEEKEKLEGQVIILQEKLAWLDETETSLNAGEETFSKLFVSVPSEDRDEPNAIAELEAIALKHGLVIPSIGFADLASKKNNLYDENPEVIIPGSRVSITIVLEGSFEDVSGFIESVEKSVKFMNIRSFTYAKGENSETSLSLEIEAYAQNSESEEI